VEVVRCHSQLFTSTFTTPVDKSIMLSSPASLKVSSQTTKSAKAAAASPHAIINLIRLVKALDNDDIGEVDTPAVELLDETATIQSWRVSCFFQATDAVSAKHVVECAIRSGNAGYAEGRK
jgi:hypothetical protein